MFTMPYNAFNMVVVTRARRWESLDALKGKKVGATRGTPQEAALRRAGGIKRHHLRGRFHHHPGPPLGQVEAAALPETLVLSVAKQNPDAKLEIGFSIYAQGNSMAVVPATSRSASAQQHHLLHEEEW